MAMSGSGPFPVDNNTYNLMHALVSKLESIEAYKKYQQDGSERLFAQLIEADRAQAVQLLEAVKQTLR